VYDNLAFGLKLRKVSRRDTKLRVQRAAMTLGLEDFLDRKPRALSGGQRQRVAMGRAIVREPRAFLMDEPLSNLDAKLRVQVRAEIQTLQRTLGVTSIYVTQRPDRGDDDGRPHRRHARRPAAAGRCTRARVRAAGESVRRRVIGSPAMT